MARKIVKQLTAPVRDKAVRVPPSGRRANVFFDEFDAMRALRNACVAPVCGVSAILRAKAERRISPPPAPRIGGATSVRGAALYRDSNLDRLRTENGERFDFARTQCIIKSRRPVAERGFHDCRASACRANERSGRGGCAPSRREVPCEAQASCRALPAAASLKKNTPCSLRRHGES
ncbi:hypothetical protein [Burkholderia pseudomallei]|uniref:hypothetical protein n=1 Tax=Burkholderia pseudomallei TaxID=28450 RepID=UPI001604AF90|nr:hypothetical protein [Burkholderia pseudomallei]